jgi:hypothetical protein
MRQLMISREFLLKMYSQGKSMADIAKIKHVSIHKVNYWMDQFGIKRRSISEAIYKKRNPYGDPFEMKMVLNDYEKFLSLQLFGDVKILIV